MAARRTETHDDLSTMRERFRMELRDWGMGDDDINALGSVSQMTDLLARKVGGASWPIPDPAPARPEPQMSAATLRQVQALEDAMKLQQQDDDQQAQYAARSIHAPLLVGSLRYPSRLVYETERVSRTGGRKTDVEETLMKYDPLEPFEEIRAAVHTEWVRYHTQ